MNEEISYARSASQFRERPQGADIRPEGGVRYRIWAPEHTTVEVVILEDIDDDKIVRVVAMERDRDGYFSGVDDEGAEGDLYKYRLAGGELLPDPFSRWQPGDPFTASMVIDPSGYEWRINEWRRIPLRESVIYELHVGTFTSEGTLRAAIEKFDHLVDLGVTTIELMPLASFSGSRNWGYDGVLLFAPDSFYGHPDDLRALVDAAHWRGLNVILDVVYNHFGPDGNFLSRFSSRYFNEEKETPWGAAINFDGPSSAHVRKVFLANAAYWMDEFRFDGFRLDATHAILDESSPHILSELGRIVHERNGMVIAEDERNLASLALPPRRRGLGLDALWADDFHHSVRVALTRDQTSYFANFSGSPEELATILNQGWLFTGQPAPATGKPRGSPTEKLSLEQFVHCISNHDQVGNQPSGERLHQLISPEAYRAASTLLCLTPGVPLLFMGQEWGASTPFLYFTDHNEELGNQVTHGRRREFEEFYAREKGVEAPPVPDPQDEETFYSSRLNWVERGQKPFSGILELYGELLSLRRTHSAMIMRERDNTSAGVAGKGVLRVRFEESAHSGLLLLVDLRGGNETKLSNEPALQLPPGWGWKTLLSSNEERFGGNGSAVPEGFDEEIVFSAPEAVVLQPVQKL